MSEIYIKVTYLGDYSKDKLSVNDLKIIIEQDLCKGLSPDAYKLVIRKFEVHHSANPLTICRVNVLIKFSDLLVRPLYNDYKNYVDLVFQINSKIWPFKILEYKCYTRYNNLNPNYMWYRQEIKSFNSEFRKKIQKIFQKNFSKNDKNCILFLFSD